MWAWQPSPPPGGFYQAPGTKDKRHQSRFAISLATQRCYAEHHGYHYNVIDPSVSLLGFT